MGIEAGGVELGGYMAVSEASQKRARVNTSSNHHLEFPIFVDQEENGRATASGAGMEPTRHEETIFEGHVRYTLDEFFQESLLHNLATKIFGSRE